MDTTENRYIAKGRGQKAEGRRRQKAEGRRDAY
jgi:hypothetical protein